jgi:hypothetical protein
MKNKFIMYYLPYDVKVRNVKTQKILKLVPSYLPNEYKRLRTVSFADYMKNEDDYVLLLRPMSDLNSIIEHMFSKMIPSVHLKLPKESVKYMSGRKDLVGETDYPYSTVHKLMSLHFDVFGLLEAGLAQKIEP